MYSVLKPAKMPAAEVETTCTTPAVEKEVEKFPEKSESHCEEDKACKEAKTAEEHFKTTEESAKMGKENFPEIENKEETPNVMPGNEDKDECEGEVSAMKKEDEPTKMAENSKRKSTEGDASARGQTQEDESPPKKRKST